MVDFVKESTVGEIIGGSFQLYARHLLPLFLICLAPVLPFDILMAIAGATGNLPFYVIAQILMLVAGAFAYGAVTVAVSDVCLGNRPTLKRSYAAIGRVLGRYLGTYALAMTAFLVGLALFLIPGLVVSALFMFALPVAVIERKRAIASFKRSMALGKGFYWRNFGVLMLAMLTAIAVLTLLITVLSVIALLLGLEPEGFAFGLFTSVITDFVTPLMQIPLVLLYYDMRVRKEFFDSASLSQEMFA
jgi:hypothetical protein